MEELYPTWNISKKFLFKMTQIFLLALHVIAYDLHNINSHQVQVFERIDPWQILQCCRLGVVCTIDRNRNILSQN